MTLTIATRLRFWLLLDLLLGVLLAVQMQPILPAASRLPPAALPEAGPVPDVSVPPLDVLRATVARPVFAPDRKPAPDRQTAPASAWKGQLTVTGVVLTPGSRMAVVVRADKPGPALRLVEGAQVDGWRVMAIRPNGVTFGRDGENHEVPLHEKSKPREATQ